MLVLLIGGVVGMLANYSVEVLVSVVVSNICYVHPEPWGNDPQSDEHIFSDGLKPPTTRWASSSY